MKNRSIFIIKIIKLLSGFFNYKYELNSAELENQFFPTKFRNNFFGCPLKVGYKLWPPFVIDVQEKLHYSGFEIDFLLIVCKLLNCSLEWTEYYRGLYDFFTPLSVIVFSCINIVYTLKMI